MSHVLTVLTVSPSSCPAVWGREPFYCSRWRCAMSSRKPRRSIEPLCSRLHGKGTQKSWRYLEDFFVEITYDAHFCLFIYSFMFSPENVGPNKLQLWTNHGSFSTCRLCFFGHASRNSMICVHNDSGFVFHDVEPWARSLCTWSSALALVQSTFRLVTGFPESRRTSSDTASPASWRPQPSGIQAFWTIRSLEAKHVS